MFGSSREMRSKQIKTKIVCTIGPSTSSRNALWRLTKAGMNVARLNLSHATTEVHAAIARRIRAVARDSGTPIGLLFDIPGPKIRVGKLVSEPINLEQGSRITLTARRTVGSRKIIPISHTNVLRILSEGDAISLADGTIRLVVRDVKGDDVLCRVIRGGNLFSGKGVNIPGKKLGLRALTPKDVFLLQFALQQRADFLGLSFTTTGSDVVRAKKIVTRARSHAWVVAKIETRQAVENFDEIVQEADGVMVARGDLGVEMEIEDVPVLQKEIISKANAAGKPVITATQMLESMVTNPMPTRAEVADIANAIIDGTDAVMLSEETAVGKYPVEAVEVMKKVAMATEPTLPYREFLEDRRSLVKQTQDAISFSACQAAYDLGASCVVAHTRTGITAHRVSKFRSSVPIIALTHSESVMNLLSLLWGVYPRRVRRLSTTAEIFRAATAESLHSRVAHPRDKIVVVCGVPSTPGGTTDLLRIQIV
jgi:pyruvate kinase